MGDENQARHVLAEMQMRLSRSAYDALGIQGGAAGPDEVRAAFLQLAKTYHPQKFARMSPDIQRMANEVFLGLRAAHDQLARRQAPPKRPSGSFPALPKPEPRPGSSANNIPVRQQSTPNSVPVARPPSATPRPNQPPPPSSALNPGTQRGPVPPPTASQPIPRPAQPVASTVRTTQPVPRRMTPVGGVPVPPSGPRPAVGTQPAPADRPSSTEPELVGVYELLEKGQWEAARTTLNALIALQPKPRYKALLVYSQAREAQLEHRTNEARVDLQTALQIDPELQVAKTALRELFTKRK